MMKYLMFVAALLASAWMLRAWLLRQQRAAIVTGRPSPQAPGAGLHPREVRVIRRRAEHAAWRVAHGELHHARNPFPAGTRQHVLWTSSFHASGVALGGGTRPPHVGVRG
jgi:hypothetical protein